MARDRHASIVDAIEAGDVATGVEVVTQHMAAAAERLFPPGSLA
jgi:DNA-binding FadR family transcriptional regulator